MQGGGGGLPSVRFQDSARIHQTIPTTSGPVAGTPILEWNGREWITPQTSSLAAANQPGAQGEYQPIG